MKAQFHIPSVKPYLPRPWAEACFLEGHDDRIPDAVFADPEKIILRTRSNSIAAADATIDRAGEMSFTPDTWNEIVFDVPSPLDLTVAPLEIASVIEHDCEILRVFISSDPTGFDCYSEVHIPRNAGISTSTINEFSGAQKALRAVDFSAVRQISVGGKGSGSVRLWAAHNGSLLRAKS